MNIEKTVAKLAVAVGQVLLKYRTDHGLTRVQLAERLGVSDSRVKQLETGENAQSFKIDFVFILSDLLKVSPAETLNQLLIEAKLFDSKAVTSLTEAFSSHCQGKSVALFENALRQNDELFGNHFSWAFRMTELLLQLDEQAKVRLEISLRRASPFRSSDDFKSRILHLLEYDLEN